MAITAVTGTVTPGVITGGVLPLVFTDTTQGVGTLVSRSLSIFDMNGTLLTTITMGTNLTATYNISSDVYLSFVETIVDNTGTYTGTVNYLSTTFYDVAYANVIAQLGCSCNCGSEKLTYADQSQLFRNAALTLAEYSFGPAAQNNITAAYAIITGS